MALKRPNYALMDSRGRISALFCKGCGCVIGSMQGGRFVRREVYAETTILFEDGSRHVVNGCYTCLKTRDTPKSLQELYAADIAFDPASFRALDIARVAVGREAVSSLVEIASQL